MTTMVRAPHPLTIEAMRERGIDASGQHPNGLAEVPEQFELAVTASNQAAETCPALPGAGELLHWSIPGPANATATPEEVKTGFGRVRDEIEAHVPSLAEELEVGAP